jgi:Ni,Fe-hydrogenase III large subunit
MEAAAARAAAALAEARAIIEKAQAHVPVTRYPEAYCAAGLAEAAKQLRVAVFELERLQQHGACVEKRALMNKD